MIPVANAPLKGVLKRIPIWFDFTLDYMRHVRVPHPSGAAFSRANRLSCRFIVKMTIDRRKYPWVRLNRLQNRPQIVTFYSGLLPSAFAGQPNGCSNLFQTDLSLQNIMTK